MNSRASGNGGYSLANLLSRMQRTTPEHVKALYYQNQPLFKMRPDILEEFSGKLRWDLGCALVGAASQAQHLDETVFRRLAGKVAIQSEKSHSTRSRSVGENEIGMATNSVDWRTSIEILNVARKAHGHHSSSMLISSVLRTCASSRQWEAAISVLKYADKRHEVLETGGVAQWMLPLAAKACATDAQWDKSLKLLGLFHRAKPDALNALVDPQSSQEARGHLHTNERLRQAALQPGQADYLVKLLQANIQTTPWEVALRLPVLRSFFFQSLMNDKIEHLSAPWDVSLQILQKVPPAARDALLPAVVRSFADGDAPLDALTTGRKLLDSGSRHGTTRNSGAADRVAALLELSAASRGRSDVQRALMDVALSSSSSPPCSDAQLGWIDAFKTLRAAPVGTQFTTQQMNTLLDRLLKYSSAPDTSPMEKKKSTDHILTVLLHMQQLSCPVVDAKTLQQAASAVLKFRMHQNRDGAKSMSAIGGSTMQWESAISLLVSPQHNGGGARAASGRGKSLTGVLEHAAHYSRSKWDISPTSGSGSGSQLIMNTRQGEVSEGDATMNVDNVRKGNMYFSSAFSTPSKSTNDDDTSERNMLISKTMMNGAFVSLLLYICCASASPRGGLEVLKQARSNGLQLKDDEKLEAFLFAHRYGQMEVARQLVLTQIEKEEEAAEAEGMKGSFSKKMDKSGGKHAESLVRMHQLLVQGY